ncbi:MAG: AI-2E family transporter [Ruminococcus sp.]|nr:AI-2E family transporter [Ruminococcus sp.]
MDKKELKSAVTVALLAVAVCFIVQNFPAITQFLSAVGSAAAPLIIGCIIAYIFNIIMVRFEKLYFPKATSGFLSYSRRPVCLVLAFGITAAVITLVLKIVIPEIISAGKLIYEGIPAAYQSIRRFASEKLVEYPQVEQYLSNMEIEWKSIDWNSVIQNVFNGAYGLLSSAISVIGAVTSTVTSFVLALIFAIYVLLRKDKLSADAKRVQKVLFSEKVSNKVNHFLSCAHETFTSFFVGQFIEAIILGSLCFVGSWALRLPYAAMSGTIVGVTALIPVVGGLVGAAVSAFIIFTVDPAKALVFLIFLIILQQFETNIIYPKVVGSSVGLPGIWVIAAVTVGGGLFGVLGMLVGVPLAATVYKLCFEELESREKKLGIPSPEPAAEKSQAVPKTDRKPPARKGRKK